MSTGTISTMQLGLSLGYWGAQPPTDLVDLVQAAEGLGYDAVWSAESWGSDNDESISLTRICSVPYG